MCCRYYYADQIREMMEDLIASQTIKLAEPLQVKPGRDIRPSDASAVICRDGDTGACKMHVKGNDRDGALGIVLVRQARAADDDPIHPRLLKQVENPALVSDIGLSGSQEDLIAEIKEPVLNLLGDLGKERMVDAGDNQTDRLCSGAGQAACQHIGRIVQILNDGIDFLAGFF